MIILELISAWYIQKVALKNDFTPFINRIVLVAWYVNPDKPVLNTTHGGLALTKEVVLSGFFSIVF